VNEFGQILSSAGELYERWHEDKTGPVTERDSIADLSLLRLSSRARGGDGMAGKSGDSDGVGHGAVGQLCVYSTAGGNGISGRHCRLTSTQSGKAGFGHAALFLVVRRNVDSEPSGMVAHALHSLATWCWITNSSPQQFCS
jgi:hypothetical protein